MPFTAMALKIYDDGPYTWGVSERKYDALQRIRYKNFFLGHDDSMKDDDADSMDSNEDE